MIRVIGVSGGLETLPARLREELARADLIVAGRRFLKELGPVAGETVPLTRDLEGVLRLLREHQDRSVVVLVSGDPLFFGLGRRLCEALPRDRLSFHPAPSSVQLALARLKLPWEEARVVSLHGRRPRNLHLEIAPFRLAVFLTDPHHTPSWIASYLLERGVRGRAHVLEDLGYPEERCTTLPLEDLPGRTFRPLNVLVLEKEPGARRLLFGLPEDRFRHRRGLITKAEVRAAVVAALAPFPEATVWDLGAGSGAVGLELAGLCFRGEAHLVERNPEQVRLIRENLAASLLDNVFVWEEDVAEAVGHLPRPDLVFVGGGFGRLAALGEGFLRVLRRGARLAATFASLEHLTAALAFLEGAGLEVGVTGLSVVRGYRLPDGSHALEARNPVFLLTARADGGV